MECPCRFLLHILFPLKMNIVIYNSEYILLSLHIHNNIISLFQMGSYILPQYIHMYINIYALLSQNECCHHLHDVLLYFQIYLKPTKG